MENLTKKEKVKISGGHKGTAYKIGKAVGDTLEVIVAVVGARKLFF